jgi:hypothetical protein
VGIFPSPDEDVPFYRHIKNCDHTLVQVASSYECLLLMVPQLDMRSLEALKYSCKALRAAIGIENPDVEKMFRDMRTVVRPSELPDYLKDLRNFSRPA